MRVKAVRDRVYADFFMPPRLHEYERLLVTARAAGYRVKSIDGFRRLIEAEAVDPTGATVRPVAS